MQFPDFSYELPLWGKGYMVIGVDEVGRGALAGPLYVGAVCFHPPQSVYQLRFLTSIGINDSKKILPEKRKKLAASIKKLTPFHACASVTTQDINAVGIVKATYKAIRKAVQKMSQQLPEQKFVLIDAFYVKYIRGIGLKNQKAIIKGDEISISIAAASIIAKVERDKYMEQLSQKYPSYFWHKNKGYGTKKHIQALVKHGKTDLHRNLFIRNIKTHSSSAEDWERRLLLESL